MSPTNKQGGARQECMSLTEFAGHSNRLQPELEPNLSTRPGHAGLSVTINLSGSQARIHGSTLYVPRSVTRQPPLLTPSTLMNPTSHPSHNSSSHPPKGTHPGAMHHREQSPIAALAGSSQHPSLPSIRQLHPDLPLSMSTDPSYGRRQSISYSSPAAIAVGSRPPQDESDAEVETQEPPKKKRRRQALSCTECKRRKIKCDRAQPCGPCVRRGEPNKCQWHVIEPMEKYVTRSEYDELKARVAQLESFIQGLVPSGVPGTASRQRISSNTIPSGPTQRIEHIQGTAITPYHQVAPSAGPSTYPGAFQHLPPASRVEPQALSDRQPKLVPIRSPTLPSRPPASHSQSHHAMQVRSPNDPHPSMSPSSIHSMPPSSESRSPASVSSRRASLSLAAITSPYTPEPRPQSPPKKFQAQTPTAPGQRLRTEPAPPDSARTPHHHQRPPHGSPVVGQRQAQPIQA
ncbi:uncharacterized protein LAESUDRAFT_810571 [Laetiporus sulphureus 93-53]|uniref:Zn(2)-C6 fungal-type domain-containing protein n=1 Tax=Laetiporus sulphureus 93-53 TaxID=1314785 RepID=A0A165FY31_9APHY|nr:uncharacterized protein LAESUDRAFT_810571 [Laetiporus sulphureus 93-53]KZT09569.1 hypothetical protein LAESUDRAFT_810571 [Laetiporus sulphureus 93-53]